MKKHIKSPIIILLGILLFTACGVQTTAQQSPIEQQSDESQQSDVPQQVESETAVLPESESNPVIISEQTDTITSEIATLSSISATAVYSDDGCPDEHFLDVQAHPNNSAYAAPSLTVTCEDQTMTIQTNNIPNFEFVATTPSDLQTQDFTITIPTNPVLSDTVTDIPLLGTTAVTVSGLVIYGPNEGANLDFGDPYLDEILDYCNGHTGPNGEYHFHAAPSCLFEEYDGQVGLVVGYALDGFPILAPFLCEDANCSSVSEVQSSWALTNPEATAAWDKHSYVEGQSELDQCNGMQFSDGSYAYFATESFPYFMSCYRGTVELTTEANGQGLPQDSQQQGNQDPPEINFSAAATTLNVSEQALRDALGAPPPDFATAAATLGVSEQQLRDALGVP